MNHDAHDEKVNTSQQTALKWPILLCSLPIFTLSFVLPIYAKRLGASAVDIGSLFSLMAIVMIVTRPIVGWSLDRVGRKMFFIAGLLCYVGAMGVFALAETVSTLYLARLIQGIGGALTWLTAYTIVTDLAPSTSRGEALGLVDSASHRGAFYGMLAAMALIGGLPLRAGWFVLFMGFAVLAAVGAGLAYRRIPETRSASPQAPTGKRALSWPVFKLLVVVAVVGGASALTRPLILIFLQDKFTTDIRLLALAFVPAGLVMSFLPSYLGRLSDHLGRVPLVILGLVGSGVMSFLIPQASTLGWFMVVCTFKACSMVIAAPAQKALLGDLTAPEERGTGYGLYAFAGSLGAAVGPLAGGWLYETIGPTAPFYANAILLLAGAVWVIVFFGRTSRHMLAAESPPT